MPIGKYGRRPPKNAPALRLSSILTGTIPAHPISEDYLAQLVGWQMLGNDTYGDCVAVTWANTRRLMTALLGDAEHYPDLAGVLNVYTTQNPRFPADDNGMDIQTLLEYLVRVGGPDGVKAVAFAKVDTGNLDEVKAAEAIFGSVWTGITVTDANESEFSTGRPWDYHPTSGIAGGHSVISGGYLSQPTDDIRFITWATETGFTDAFWAHEAEEAWIVVWPEHLSTRQFQQGIDLPALAAAYKALTGRDLPVPTPPQPAPPPQPKGCLDAADKALFAALAVWMLARHARSNQLAARAVQAWARAKGLIT
jgi:hypothetical protein